MYQEIFLNGQLQTLSSVAAQPEQTQAPTFAALTSDAVVTMATPPQPGCPTHESCTPTYCQSNAECVDLWTEKTCDCLVGYAGDFCESQTMAHFDGASFLHYVGLEVIQQLVFWLTVQGPTGVVAYTVSTQGGSRSGGLHCKYTGGQQNWWLTL